MTTQQILFVAVSIVIASLALVGALAARRVLARSSAGLRSADERLSTRVHGIPDQMGSLRRALKQLDAAAETVLWTLGNLDARIDHANEDLRAKRAASDTLRVRLIESRVNVARLRQLVRLLMRLGELRREFLE